MANKYDSFIELTPGYESVVDISSDSRNADFWSRYIVNDDMVTAVRLLAKSLRPDDPNEDVWHYWIKGSYGTGKTYSATKISTTHRSMRLKFCSPASMPNSASQTIPTTIS